MGRKSIPPNQRAQPISFSLKPHLIEKIDDYANDLRFSRSKFLMEAVTQYILKADMGYMAASNNVNDMTLAQKVAVGLAALQEANREGETISKHVMDALRRELDVEYLSPLENEWDDEEEEETLRQVPLQTRISNELYVAGEHFVQANTTVIGKLVNQGGRNWRAVGIKSPHSHLMTGKTLKEVMQVIKEAVSTGQVFY